MVFCLKLSGDPLIPGTDSSAPQPWSCVKFPLAIISVPKTLQDRYKLIQSVSLTLTGGDGHGNTNDTYNHKVEYLLWCSHNYYNNKTIIMNILKAVEIIADKVMVRGPTTPTPLSILNSSIGHGNFQ